MLISGQINILVQTLTTIVIRFYSTCVGMMYGMESLHSKYLYKLIVWLFGFWLLYKVPVSIHFLEPFQTILHCARIMTVTVMLGE